MVSKLERKRRQKVNRDEYEDPNESSSLLPYRTRYMTEINPITESKEIEVPSGATNISPGKYYKVKKTAGEKASKNKSNKIEKERIDRKQAKLKKEIKKRNKLREEGDRLKGGGKVGSKFFTGGMVNPSYGTEFDDR